MVHFCNVPCHGWAKDRLDFKSLRNKQIHWVQKQSCATYKVGLIKWHPLLIRWFSTIFRALLRIFWGNPSVFDSLHFWSCSAPRRLVNFWCYEKSKICTFNSRTHFQRVWSLHQFWNKITPLTRGALLREILKYFFLFQLHLVMIQPHSHQEWYVLAPDCFWVRPKSKKGQKINIF